MSVLVTTTDGYHIFTSSGKHLTSLAGHRIECFTPGADGTWLAIVDRHEIWQHDADGEWTPLVKTDDHAHRGRRRRAAPSSPAPTTRACSLDVVEAWSSRCPRSTPCPAATTWHRVGSPLQVRSMTTTADAGALLVNVHVGGIPRSVDGGADVAPHPRRRRRRPPGARPSHAPGDRGRRRVGRLVPQRRRRRDVGAAPPTGMEIVVRARRGLIGDDVLVTVSDGPWTDAVGDRTARQSTAAPPEKVTGGLPDYLAGNIDTRCIASDGRKLALVDGAGDVWQSTDGCEGFGRVADGLIGVTGVAIA